MAKKIVKTNTKIANKSELKNFSPLDYIKEHPANPIVVKNVQKEVIEYIKSKYANKSEIIWTDWYVGISKDPDGDRTSGHKNRKKLTELKFYHKFYAHSLANARQVEVVTCADFKLNNCKTIGGVTAETKWCYVYNWSESPKL
jgi:hypothetical protein